MRATKHDLCAGEARLDLKALQATAETAVWLALDRLQSNLNKVRDELHQAYLPGNKDGLSPMLYILTEDNERQARAMNVAAETLYAVSKAFGREEIRVVRG